MSACFIASLALMTETGGKSRSVDQVIVTFRLRLTSQNCVSNRSLSSPPFGFLLRMLEVSLVLLVVERHTTGIHLKEKAVG